MNILALETSTHHISVALSLSGKILERSETLINGGSEKLLPWVNALLAEAGVSLKQLDGIAYGAGPGGFTGLRLSCGVAQGLAYGADLPTVGICTLESIALNSGVDHVLSCLDARMNEVYLAAYVRESADTFSCHLQPCVLPPSEVVMPADLPPASWIGAGDGFATYAAVLQLPQLVKIQTDICPTAKAVALLATPRFLRGEGEPAMLAAPLYVRDKVALTTAERLARGGKK